MRTERDKTLEELFSPLEELADPQEARELQETASGLLKMEKAGYSPAFRDELRERLLQKAHRQEEAPTLLNRLYRIIIRPGGSFRPAYAAVTAALIIISFTVFSLQDNGVSPGSEVADPHEPSPGFTVSMREELPGSGENNTPGQESPSVVPERDDEVPVTPELPREEPIESLADPSGSSENSGVVEETPENPEDPVLSVTDPESEELAIPEKPVFQVEGKIRELRLSGTVSFAPLYVGGAGQEDPVYENVSAVLRPSKIVLSAPEQEEAEIFGTSAWAAELLKNQGFTVRQEDSLQVETQQTLQGAFAEIFYQPGARGGSNPVLIIQCGEEGNILGYYYQEDGKVLEAGFYKLLSPAQALKAAQHLDVYAPLQPSLVFREVTLTFNTFESEDGGRQTLPAYCFSGMETTTDSEVKIYLPAVSGLH